MFYILLVLMGLYFTVWTICILRIKTLPGKWRPVPLYKVEIQDWSPEFASLYKMHFTFTRWPTVEGLLAALEHKRKQVEQCSIPKVDMLALIDTFKRLIPLCDREKLAHKVPIADSGWFCGQVGGVHIYDGNKMVGGIRIDQEYSWE